MGTRKPPVTTVSWLLTYCWRTPFSQNTNVVTAIVMFFLFVCCGWESTVCFGIDSHNLECSESHWESFNSALLMPEDDCLWVKFSHYEDVRSQSFQQRRILHLEIHHSLPWCGAFQFLKDISEREWGVLDVCICFYQKTITFLSAFSIIIIVVP